MSSARSGARTVAVVLAAGAGRRAGADDPKQLRLLAGRPVVAHAVAAFAQHPGVHEVWVVGSAELLDTLRTVLVSGVDRFVLGGRTRSDSVACALAEADDGVDRMLVHDAARPGLPTDVVDRVLGALDELDAVATVVPVSDTLAVLEDGVLRPGPERATLVAHQTPQGFRTDALRRAHEARQAVSREFTDDVTLVAELVEGSRVGAVAGDPRLHKITTAEDLAVVEALLRVRPPHD